MEEKNNHLLVSPRLISNVGIKWEALRKWNGDYFVTKIPNHKFLISFYRSEVSYLDSTYKNLIQLTATEFVKKLSSEEVGSFAAEEATSFIFSHTDLIKDLDSFKPIIDGEVGERMISLWWSSKNKVTDWHTDNIPLVLCQIKGTKTIKLLAPVSEDEIDPIVAGDFMKRLTSFGWSEEDAYREVQNSRFAQKKAFADDSQSQNVLSYQLFPGDCIFIPEGWWHATRTEQESIAINFEVYDPNELNFD